MPSRPPQDDDHPILATNPLASAPANARGYQDLDLSDLPTLRYHPGPSIISGEVAPLRADGTGYTLTVEARFVGEDPDLRAAYAAMRQAAARQHGALSGRRTIARTLTLTLTEQMESDR